MTKAEYAKLYRQSRVKVGNLTAETMQAIRKLYIEAAELAAVEARGTVAAGLSDLTSEGWRGIEESLRAGADLIANGTYDQIPRMIYRDNATQLGINADYMTDAIASAGLSDVLVTPKITKIMRRVNDRLVQATVTRQYQDGYTFSERIFSEKIKLTSTMGANGKLRTVKSYVGMHGDYQYRVRSIIQLGHAQGRDSVAIARDIQNYAFKGKAYMFKAGKWGKLIPGTAQYKKRIPQEIDYRAARLARSEQHASLQQAALQQGDINPACQDLFDWLLNPTLVHDNCECPTIAAGSPYSRDRVPGYPHPNCGCTVQPHLVDHDVFVSDLRRWNAGESVPYLDDWYYNKYL